MQSTFGPIAFDTLNSRLNDVAGSFEDRLKVTSAFALIGGVRLEDLTLSRNAVNADGTIPFQPFSQTWRPVSYRAAYTYEPMQNLMFYSMYATAYDPAVAANLSRSRREQTTLLTSSRIYETAPSKSSGMTGRSGLSLSMISVQRNVFVRSM